MKEKRGKFPIYVLVIAVLLLIAIVIYVNYAKSTRLSPYGPDLDTEYMESMTGAGKDILECITVFVKNTAQSTFTPTQQQVLCEVYAEKGCDGLQKECKIIDNNKELSGRQSTPCKVVLNKLCDVPIR